MAVILLGFYAANQLPIGLLPEVGIPRLSVQISYPNASARTLEDAAVTPLRNALLQVNGLIDIRSEREMSLPSYTSTFLSGQTQTSHSSRSMKRLTRRWISCQGR